MTKMRQGAGRKASMEIGQGSRQGDVLMLRIEAIPATAKPVKRKGDIVVEWGEVTGHAHRICSAEAKLYTDGDTQFLRVLDEAGVDMTHEEHGTITWPKGDYIRMPQVEWTAFGERVVRD